MSVLLKTVMKQPGGEYVLDSFLPQRYIEWDVLGIYHRC